VDSDPPPLSDAVPPLADGGDAFVARLERWAAEARVDEAARRRSHERWLLQQAEEEGSFVGSLTDLAERRVHVAVHTRSGSRHLGRVDVVGVDFASVRRANGTEVLVAFGVVTSVRTQPGEPVTLGDRVATTQLSLADVLARLAAERQPIMVVHDAGDAHDAVRGTLRSVGDDVVVLRLDGQGESAPGVAYLPLHAVDEVILGA
jgi:hypothetical protein